MGNLKFDIAPPLAMQQLGQQLRDRFGAKRKIFLAASTREGEEALLLPVLQQADIPDLLTVIVPRHPQRFDAVAALLGRAGVRFQRRSENAVIAAETQVVLGDSMGELFAYYTACDIAYIGGSLLPFGGQNLIEACAVGKPAIIGPHTYNFTQASEQAVAGGAAIRVQDAPSLLTTLNNLFSEPDRITEMGRAGRRFVDANRGATERSLQYITNFLRRTEGLTAKPGEAPD